MSSPEHKSLIWNLISKIKVGMLTTVNGEGKKDLHARPMSLVQDDYDGTLYFFTSKNSGKVYEVVNDGQEVGITFSNPSEQVYVSLSGQAKLTQNKELISKYWSSGVAAWFPGGIDDPEVAILEVKINKGEHWNADESKIIQLFEFVKAKLTDEVPEIGEHEKFGQS
jgi:general stress protein 26